MNVLHRSPVGGKHLRAPVAPYPRPSDRIRGIVRQLRRLNLNGRWDPEQIAGCRLGIERDLLDLARELDI
jgi:hypothetical protein